MRSPGSAGARVRGMDMETVREDNPIAGLVGSLIGSLIGVACIVAVSQLGYVAAISGMVMAVCAIKGYALLGGAMSRRGAVIAGAVILLMTYVGHHLDFAVHLSLAAQIDPFTAFRAVGDLLADGALDPVSYWGNLVLLYGFTLLGAVPALRAAFHASEAGDVSAAQLSSVLGLEMPDREERKRAFRQNTRSLGETLTIFLPLGGMMLGLVVVAFSISPPFMEWLLGGALSPGALLQGYSHWYLAILVAVVLGVLLTVIAVVLMARRRVWSAPIVTLMALSIGLLALLGGIMIAKEDVPGLFWQAREDLAQIESDQLREVTVWLSPKSRSARLPGPYTAGQPTLVARYGGISEDTGGEWVEFYVPDCLGFSLDPNALYEENESIAWNRENARQYRLRVTEHFRLVISVEPLGVAAAP